jgi:hypothetical protein
MSSRQVFFVILASMFLVTACGTALYAVQLPEKQVPAAVEKAGKAVPIPKIGVTMMKAQPETYSGTCPTAITFKGHIAAAGMISVSKPVTVKYVFVRSDGVTGPEQTVTFTKQGAQTVSNTWHIGGPGFSTSGWQAIRIISPDPKESKKANFTLNCSN